MKIEVFRKKITQHSTTGEMYVDGKFECYTLEPSVTPDHVGHPMIISEVVFDVKLTKSPHFGYVTPEFFSDILAGLGRTDVRIHPGDAPKDTLGCTLVGDVLGPQPDWIAKSRVAFDKLMALLRAAEDRGEKIAAIYHDPE